MCFATNHAFKSSLKDVISTYHHFECRCGHRYNTLLTKVHTTVLRKMKVLRTNSAQSSVIDSNILTTVLPFSHIIKNLPASISRRLTDISSDETAFGDAKPIYDKALADSGFCEMTEFLEDRKSSSEKRKRKNRRRNITWFNPPYSQNVSTNFGRRFRTLISKHFPRNSKLLKIFNINTLKLSYSCMPNMAAVISQHNSSILGGGKTIGENYVGGRPCNCCVKEDCLLNGTCQLRSVVYKATITATRKERDYTGLTAQTFKQRYNAR